MLGLGIAIPHQHTISFSLGDTHQGGLIFYLDGSGGGLIAAPADEAQFANWGCIGSTISGADGTAIGTGAQNTIDINAGCTTANIAADKCRDSSQSGYTDWFLPSKDELNQMYVNLQAEGLGNFQTSWYWSSTEHSASQAKTQLFTTTGGYEGLQGQAGKNSGNVEVRPCRAF